MPAEYSRAFREMGQIIGLPEIVRARLNYSSHHGMPTVSETTH
jgi:hypothetical protein